MLNVLSVILELAEPIRNEKLNQVDKYFVFHPKYRINVKDETRFKFNSEQLNEWVQTLGLFYFIV